MPIGLVDEFVRRGLGRHDRHGREQERQDRRAGRGRDLDGQVVDGRGRELDVAEVLDADLAAELRHLDAVEGEGDVRRVERGAVVEGDAVAKLDAPGVGVDLGPLGRKPRFQRAGAGVELGERLVDVLQDNPADVRAGRHAGLDDVEFLVQDDADRPVFLGQRGSAREKSRRQGKLPGEGLLHVFLRCSADCCCLGFWLGSDDLLATDNPHTNILEHQREECFLPSLKFG